MICLDCISNKNDVCYSDTFDVGPDTRQVSEAVLLSLTNVSEDRKLKAIA